MHQVHANIQLKLSNFDKTRVILLSDSLIKVSPPDISSKRLWV